jgi:hypothetical protein
VCGRCAAFPPLGTDADFEDETRRALAVVRAVHWRHMEELRVLVVDLLPPLPTVRNEDDDPFGHVLDAQRRWESLLARRRVTRAVVSLAGVADDLATVAFGPEGGEEWLRSQIDRPPETGDPPGRDAP